MIMNKVFTYVPQRSYEAFVRPSLRVDLNQLLTAFAVDPLAAEDAAEFLGVEGVPHSLKDFAYRGHGVYRQALETISQWMAHEHPSRPTLSYVASVNLKELYEYDSRLGIWAGSAVARYALSKLEAQVLSLTHAVDSVEDFVVYTASKQEVLLRSDSVRQRAKRPMSRVSYTGVIRCVDSLVSMVVGDESDAPSDLVSYAIDASDSLVSPTIENDRYDTYRERDAAASRIRKIMADACLSYPVIP